MGTPHDTQMICPSCERWTGKVLRTQRHLTPPIWVKFMEDFGDELFDWSLRLTLEIFWHYCQGGKRAVVEFLRGKP